MSGQNADSILDSLFTATNQDDLQMAAYVDVYDPIPDEIHESTETPVIADSMGLW